MTDDDVERVDACLPLHRLDGHQTYLVAWDEDDPAGHAHIAWIGTRLGVPEIQDVYVLPERRRRGVASEGMILIRGATLEVNDTVVYLVKELAVDYGQPRSS